MLSPIAQADQPRSATAFVHEGVLAAARSHPQAVALVDADRSTLTYAQLLRRVDALARAIDAAGPAGVPVAVHSHKSIGTIVAMLAVLRAGRAYVPIDPSAPQKRREYIVEQAGCALMVADTPRARAGLDIPLLDVSQVDDSADLSWEPPAIDLDDTAYILFTSGSTGQPKGVVITHRNAGAFVSWAARAFPLRPGDQVAVHSPLHFDISVYDVYVGLAAGATVHPIPERTALFPQALLTFLTERRITHLYAVPSALTALVNRSTVTAGALPGLRQILYAGEEFQPTPLAALMAAAPNAVVTNLYGPIETNVVTHWTVDAPPEARVPLGRPIDNVWLALLGDDGSVSVDGPAEGEIVVAGDCVTPGYLHRPELTERAFVELEAGGRRRRCYRTGDFARRDSDGLLRILGRRDFMVKTRGYRVELGEIETAIDTHPDVADVAVVALADPEQGHRLHAVVVPAGGERAPAAVAAELLAYCRGRLPAYMVPAQIHVTDDLPRTGTGKIARRQLQELVTTWTERTS